MIASYLYIPVLNLLIRYRRTMLGPIWLLIGPSLFIVLLGGLFSRVGSVDPKLFIPHLAIGIVLWGLISGITNQSATVFQRSRSQILQAGHPMDAIVLIDLSTTVISFLHQIPIIVIVMLYYGIELNLYSLVSLVGLALIVINGIWMTRLFGIIGARFRDFGEILQAIMRVAMLASPIVWMPNSSTEGGLLDRYLIYNPFYHFLEIFRAPLLGLDIQKSTWLFVIFITIFGFFADFVISNRYRKYVPLWI